MEITTNVEGSKIAIDVKGKLTVQSSSDLSAAIEQVGTEVCDIDINLADVDYVSSAGLRVFVAADKLAARRGGVMRLLNPNDEVMEVFDMTGLADVLTIER